MKHGVKSRKPPVFSFKVFYLLFAAFAACSFDYGVNDESGENKPDIVMEDIEYVRVREGDPMARFEAEYAERWEDRQIMELRNSSFEQMEGNGETINAAGRAGTAVVQLSSGDVALKDGVRVSIESEDFTIGTAELEGKDKEKTLAGGKNDVVDITRSDGTSFTGRGFSADIRSRTWDFLGEVEGTYVEEEAEAEEEAAETDESSASEQPEARPVPLPPPLPEDK